MHPEVKNIGLVTLLYAGTTSKYSFKYSILNDTVKKFKQWSLSAGNVYINIKNGTSETLCNETVTSHYNSENLKSVSIHVPKHLKPNNKDHFGHYLSGLIDGDGHFSKQNHLIIEFHILDASLAYFIKKKLGFGSVKRVKDKNGFILVISHKKGIEKIIHLINGKIRTENIFNQINNILNSDSFSDLKKEIDFKLNLDNHFENHWLAGFSDVHASFQIKILKDVYPNNVQTEIRLNFQIDQKNNDIILLIKNFMGGNISYEKNQDIYCYVSSSFGSVRNVIHYFDRFHLLSSKHVNYLKWRRAYLIIQKKDHLNQSGFNQIIKLKNTMNRLSDVTV